MGAWIKSLREVTAYAGDGSGVERLSLSEFLTVSSWAQRSLSNAFGAVVMNGQGASGAGQAGSSTAIRQVCALVLFKNGEARPFSSPKLASAGTMYCNQMPWLQAAAATKKRAGEQ